MTSWCPTRPEAFRRRRGLVAAAVLVVVALSGCATGKDAVDQEAGGRERFVSGDGTLTKYQPGKRAKAPNVTGELLDKKKFALRDYRGSVVVVNFWGSWCAPCRAEVDDLVQVADASAAVGVKFLGVNVRDSRDKAEAFDRVHKVPYPSLFDPAGRVALSFRETPPNAIPATIVIDRQGRVAAVFRKPLLATDLKPVVDEVAAES